MNLFESEIEEGFKKDICLICRKPNCKHLQDWRIMNGISILPEEPFWDRVLWWRRKKYYPICRAYAFPSPKARKDELIPQWKKLLKSKQKSMKEKEFWKNAVTIIPYESKPEIIIQIPFKHKHRLKNWIPFDSQGIPYEGIIITEIKKIPWKRIWE